MKGIPSKAELESMVERLRTGATTLIHESKSCGFSHNGPLRGALRALLGTDGYDSLMAGKRPIPNANPARVRTPGEPDAAPIIMDDSEVPVIKGTPSAEGWRCRQAGLSAQSLFISPEGVTYQYAASNAKADLIVDLEHKGLGRIRLRRASVQLRPPVLEAPVVAEVEEPEAVAPPAPVVDVPKAKAKKAAVPKKPKAKAKKAALPKARAKKSAPKAKATKASPRRKAS